MKKLMLFFLMLNVLMAAASVKEKNIPYVKNATEANLLDIYHQKKARNQDVIVFIHGGSWRSGKKDTYWFLGRNFARKGKVFVAINYPLTPNAQYEKKGYDCAKALAWVKANIAKYGGNPDRVFVMGHSAGAHLAALINQDPKYFESAGIKNPIKGVILNDAFGLNIHQYMKLQINTGDKYIPGFLQTFSDDEQEWKKASPFYTINNIQNPYLMFVGDKTYLSIVMQTPAYKDEMLKQQKEVKFIEIKGKKHIGMITQMIFGWNKLYDQIIHFIDQN